MKVATGKSILNGVAIGTLRWFHRRGIQVETSSALSPEEELTRFEQARKKAREQLKRLYHSAVEEVGEDNAAIFEIHQMMLEDEDFLDAVREIIRTQGATARTAMPQAPTKIRASLSPNRSPLQAESSPANTSSPSSPRQNLSRAKFRHRIPSLSRIRRILRLTSLPLSVKLITAALKVSPPSG